MSVLLIILLAISIESSQGFSINIPDQTDISNSNDETLNNQRRSYDFTKLRNFLLTSSAEERAARRDKQNFYKRQWVSKS